ncbi:SLAC1 anion channel family protein [Thalassospira sp.]|uniref:SLAC1 anion channel family protein n=1 Tax=Thalassospira sp. TaxID=1912094 RepID=UPI0027355D93|nr:SLAC1 anion channel family protein [Thalassospira sp.]MDP2697431.1 SLAC1 anion channel family protein [Thalassospira sp.]
MSEALQTDGSRLSHFPVSFFAMVMGLAGLTLALAAAEKVLRIAPGASLATLAMAAVCFVVLAAFYLTKMARHPQDVAAEWAHPVRIAFFPAVSISLLLIATAVLPYAPGMAKGLWIVAVALQAILTLSVVANWIGHRAFQPIHLNPAWFIPAVGNVIVPVAGASMGFVEISWLFFSAGIMFWIVLLTLVVNRLIFHDPLPGRMLPTLVILIAPPAVAFIAYVKLGGEIDAFARILINIGYVFAAVVATQLPKFKRLPFALSWWALSFPVAALTIASLMFSEMTGSMTHRVIGLGLLVFLLVVVAGLLLRTAAAIRANEICKPE